MTATLGVHSKGASGGGSSATTAAVTSAGGASSCFLVGIVWYDAASAPTSFGDSKGNTWTQVGTTRSFTLDGNGKTILYKCEGGTGGAGHTITATFGTSLPLTIFFCEIVGFTTAVVDQFANATSSTSNPFLSGSITTTSADEALVAFTFTYQNATEVRTWNNSFTEQETYNDGTLFFTGALATRIVSTTGTYQASWTSTGPTTDEALTWIISVKDSGGGGGAVSGGYDPQPMTRPSVASPSRQVQGWEPLRALSAAAVAAVAVFSPPPPSAPRKAPKIDNWEPLPAIPTYAAGFSEGQAYSFSSPLIEGWDPLPGLPQTSTPKGVFSQEPAVRKPAQRGVDGWEPVGQLPPSDLGLDQGPQPRAQLRSRVEAWEPLPNVQLPPAQGAAPFDSGPLLPATRRARVDAWAPLAGLPSDDLGFQPALPPLLRKARQEGTWEPLGPLGQFALPGQDIQVPDRPQKTRVVVDGWDPIAGMPLEGGFDPGFTAPAAIRRVDVQGWDPLPSVQAPPQVAAVAFSASPVPAKVRPPRIFDWEPLEDFAAPPPIVSPGAYSQTVDRSRLVAARVDAWEPLPSPALQPAVGVFSDAPRIGKSPARRSDGWDPLPELPTAFIFSDYQTARRAQKAQQEGWEPLTPLVQAPVLAFSESPQPRSARVRQDSAWEPLPAVTLAPLVPWCEPQFAQPRAVKSPVVDAWEPLGSVVLPPIVGFSGFEPSPLAPKKFWPVRIDYWDPIPSSLVYQVPVSVGTAQSFINVYVARSLVGKKC